jgi:hypothetical protein
VIRNRDELIYLLTDAAELEHLLCCQYLFAAFSLKRGVDEGLSWEQLNHVNDWTQTILLVARQEMEHLGLANNLLTAIGGSPHFRRPNFPQPAKYYPRPMPLERFNQKTIERFICFERPEHIEPKDAFCHDKDHHIKPAGGGRVRGRAQDPITPYPIPYQTAGELYRTILQGFEEIPLSDRELFIGPSDAQVGGDVLDLNFDRVGGKGGVYDVTLVPVTDRRSARRAIELIIEQGEGTSSHDEHSHYGRFMRVLDDFRRLRKADRAFEPARPVLTNPLLRDHADAGAGVVITHPQTKAVMDLFNSAYETMLFLLTRFYAHTDETAAELKALKYTAFFPMMTMAIRPLGELLTTMPAWETGDEPTAGPSFETDRSIGFLPHKQSAWIFLHERLAQLAADCHDLSRRSGMPQRLAYIAKSLKLLAAEFQIVIDA